MGGVVSGGVVVDVFAGICEIRGLCLVAMGAVGAFQEMMKRFDVHWLCRRRGGGRGKGE